MFKKAAAAVLKSTDDIPFALIILSTIAVVMLGIATFAIHAPVGVAPFTETLSEIFGAS